MEHGRKTRVLLVDDHEYMRVALGAILAKDMALEVVGEAGDGLEGVRRCGELRPDLILMDLEMPNMDGLEATRRIKAEFPRTSVLIFTSHADHGLLMDAVRAGAAGYVLKGERPRNVLEAVRAVLVGETPLDQGLAMRLLRHLAEEGAARAAGAPTGQRAASGPVSAVPNPLTPRETEVLVCLASGKTNRQIAKELHLSLSTVKRHVERVIAKLEVSDRTQAAVRAVEMGLMRPSAEREGTANP